MQLQIHFKIEAQDPLQTQFQKMYNTSSGKMQKLSWGTNASLNPVFSPAKALQEQDAREWLDARSIVSHSLGKINSNNNST